MHDSDPLERFTLLEKIGEGCAKALFVFWASCPIFLVFPCFSSCSSYGAVHKALDKKTGETVAIKIIPVENDTSDLKKEIDILSACEDRFVVSYKGSWEKDSAIWIVMEYCAAGSLQDLMMITQKTLQEDQMAVLLRETLKGLQYLHGKKKIHRDIKCGNILLNSRGDCKLGAAFFLLQSACFDDLISLCVCASPHFVQLISACLLS